MTLLDFTFRTKALNILDIIHYRGQNGGKVVHWRLLQEKPVSCTTAVDTLIEESTTLWRFD